MMGLAGFPFQQLDARFALSLSAQLLTQLLGERLRPDPAASTLTRECALELLNSFELAGPPLVMRSESARWSKVIKAAGLKLER